MLLDLACFRVVSYLHHSVLAFPSLGRDWQKYIFFVGETDLHPDNARFKDKNYQTDRVKKVI